ncbi:tetratricopeptide repeat-containing sensor histidine kinase [Aquaticitalea lipolytica]|uniref:tetratricopeptide repeat-containing sensor histidine kinase n=1 Tax=Aquaticitalea lipolytica TaxID=1247562 RepID=UPI0024B91225|nr:tetratricopeptide repeat-containing sensor histidine kinase [Aquaticitalea lipolytica]
MKQLITLAAFFSALFCFSQTNEIDSLSLQLAYQKQDVSKVETSMHLIRALYKANDYKKALMYIDETERLSKSLNYTKGNAEANYYKALIYASKNDYFNAIDNYNKSKRLYKQINDTLGIAKINNNIGIIEIKRGNYVSGLENSLSAIKVFESRHLREDLSSAYNNLAEAYFNTHQIDKALEFNVKALNVREQLRDSLGIKSSTKNIAMLYSMRKEHRKAIEYYENVLRMLNPKQDQALRGEILPRIGNEYLQFKDYDNANKYLAEGLQYNRSINNKDGMLRTLNSIGQLNLEQGNLKVAQMHIAEAYNYAKGTTDKIEVLKNYRLLMKIDSTNNNFQSAYNWQRQYFSLKEELESQDLPKIPVNTDSIKEGMSSSIDDFDDISSLEKNIENENQVKKLKAISYILVAAFITVLTILLLIYLKRKNTLRYTQELEEKNEQIQIQNEAILEQTHHLEEINKVKDRLFSIVSHDLKDSISSIKGFLDLLKEDSISKEEFNELIPELSENANNASLLLYNLLNWSKSQMQNLEPSPEMFNIQEVFHNKISLVEQKVEQKRIVVIDESQRDFVYADKSMIEIVIQNLITNAVKFSRVGDIITISNRSQNGNALICVEDTGVGISKENLSKLFKNNNFTTIGTKNEKGTGLGLTICKELVELNKGRIWVESTQNVGSKFFIELPKSKISE